MTTNSEQSTTNVVQNKANLKRDEGFSASYTRDCHGTHRTNPRSCLRQEDAGAARAAKKVQRKGERKSSKVFSRGKWY